MTVLCEGDCHVVKQLGEKQDFEAELTRLGYKHEHFTLQVTRAASAQPRWATAQKYSVTVANIATEQHRVYEGGPGREWVAECARDLAKGAFGPPFRTN